MKILVTGNAGFVGFHVARKLIERGDSVVGLDFVDAYYDVALKRARLAALKARAEALGADYTFVEGDIADRAALDACFSAHGFDRVIHLAAQAGVRYSLERPEAYISSNLVGFGNMLEACRHHRIAHLTYASSSSVYGANVTQPYSEHHGVDHPLQLYAATKRSNELMAHAYSHLYRLPTTGLRLFTVYGPWGRPDMAPWLFAESIVEGQPIQLFNHGNHMRDFTYVDDVAEGIVRTSDKAAEPSPEWSAAMPDPATSAAPFRIFNLGNGRPVALRDYLQALETALGRKAEFVLKPLQPGDVPDTFADTRELERHIGPRQSTPLATGVGAFVDWFLAYREGRFKG